MAADEEDASLLISQSKSREAGRNPRSPYGSFDESYGGLVSEMPTEGYCMVFEREPEYGFSNCMGFKKTMPYQIVKDKDALKVQMNEDLNRGEEEYAEDGWDEKAKEWSDDREDNLLKCFKNAGIKYKIITDGMCKHWYVIIATTRHHAQHWAEKYNIDVPIDPEAAVLVGRKPTKKDKKGEPKGAFLLAERTKLPDEPPTFAPKSTRHSRLKKKAQPRAQYDKLKLEECWKHIHIGYNPAIDSKVYLKEDGETVVNHRLYLRLLYEMLTEGDALDGADFIVEKYLQNPYHPLVHFFALHHHDSAPWAVGRKTNCCKCNLFYDVDRNEDEPEERRCCRCECDFIGSKQSFKFCDAIRDYYGEAVGFYFVFLVHYTKWLYPMAAIGAMWFLIQMAGFGEWGIATPGSTVIVLVAVMWSTLMIENWYRREWKLRLQWGMMRYTQTEVPRPSFKGEIAVSRENGELIETYKNWYSYCCKITFSMSMMMLCVAIVIVIVATLFLLRGQNREDQVLTVGIGMANSIQIFIMNKLYTWLAYKLNEWEGHRLQQDYYNNLVIKRIIFIIFNSFYSLFYIGFFDDNPLYDDDEVRLEAMRTQLVTLFLMALFLQNTLEVLFPFIGNKVKRMCAKKEHQDWLENNEDQSGALLKKTASPAAIMLQAGGAPNTQRKQHILDDIREQMQLSATPDVLDNTAEIVVLHGYIMLFVIIFPIMPLLALINNYVEIRVDFYNLLTAQRPIPESAAGLGVWKTVMSCFNIVAVFSNLAIITFRTPLIHNLLSDFGEEHDTTVNLTIFYFCVALSLLFIIFTIRFVVDDYSQSTREGIARQAACEKHLLMAAKHERAKKRQEFIKSQHHLVVGGADDEQKANK